MGKSALRKDTKIQALAEAKWTGSGLTNAQAKCLQLTPLEGGEVAKLSGNFQAVGALKIPYFSLEGKPTGFYRLRYLEPLLGFAGAVEKPQRYAQAKNTINEAYLPPLLDSSWSDIADDPQVAIAITEGELKAAAGCAHSIPTIGLGGVDVWRSGKRGIDLLSPMDRMEWKDRPVYVIFDSDAATNPNIVRAQRALARYLLHQGAHPVIVALPEGKGKIKQGLDDFLLKHSPDSLQALIKLSPPLPEADALWTLNEQVLYARDPGIVIEMATGQRMDPARFCSHHYANVHYVQTTQDRNGKDKHAKKQTAPHWIQWENRSEVDRITYVPGQPHMLDGSWNTWPGWGCEPVKGSVTLWSKLLDHLFGGDKVARTWFEQWCAYPIQHPGAKMYTAALLWSADKGIGKTLVGYSLMSIYGKNSVEIKSRQLKKTFNSWAKDRQFIVGDEITAGEARVDADWLKGTITQHVVTVEEKYIPEYQIPDCMNFLFLSNHPDALFVEEGERRYFIWEILGGKMPKEFYAEYNTWLGWSTLENKAIGVGPGALFHHLLHVSLKGFDPKAEAPHTSSRGLMIRNSKSELGAWISDLRMAPERLLQVLGDKAAEDGALFTSKMLLRAFDPDKHTRMTEVAMGRQLASAGFRQVNEGQPVRAGGSMFRFYAVREEKRWAAAKPKDLAAEFERVFGADHEKY